MTKYLNETSLKELIRRIDSEDTNVLKDALDTFISYVDTVAHGEITLMVHKDADGQAYRDIISQYDQSRHHHHEDAIICTKVLNRLCSTYNLAPVFSGDESQRNQVADFCFELISGLFHNRRTIL